MKRLVLGILLFASPVHAGPIYTWAGNGQEAMGIVEPFTSPQVIDWLPTPYDATVTLTYQPDPGATLISTNGTSSSFRALYGLSITGGGSGFTSSYLTGQQFNVASIIVTVPVSGLDRIDFLAIGDPSYTGRGPTGSIEIWAPAGTLATSTVLPFDLAAFQTYALTNPGGYFSYNPPAVPGSSGATQWAGIAAGTLGDPPLAVPEPSSVILLIIGTGFFYCVLSLPCINTRIRRKQHYDAESLRASEAVAEKRACWINLRMPCKNIQRSLCQAYYPKACLTKYPCS